MITDEERNAMVEKNMGLVYYYAKKFCATNMEHDDLVQEGMIGLMDAAVRFDPGRGVKFSTYAMWHIRKTIMDAIRSKNDIVRTPRRQPSKQCFQLDQEANTMRDPGLPTIELMQVEEDTKAIHACIHQLQPRDAIVVRLRHGINTEKMTLKKVGNILGVTPERVRQIQAAAEEKLRNFFLECATLGHQGAITAEHQKESAQTETE